MIETNSILDHLTFLYGQVQSQAIYQRLHQLISTYRQGAGQRTRLTHQDAILITYGDQVAAQDGNTLPLHCLGDFCRRNLAGLVSSIHILPFYPYSSDDGFSVIDYKAMNPALGDWEDIHLLGQDFRLMFDAVINHISVKSAWFQAFLRDDPRYRNYFIVVEGNPDLSGVVRPRALPLLTHFETAGGEKAVWTTFSADQVDLNYQNPDVLLEIIDTLLTYAAHGADLIRLDAIAYLWKDTGTPCIHLPQTHRVIQLIRQVLDQVAPQVQLITETNVPHSDNISYFGDGHNEAQLVYNFALPPLVLHTLRTGNTRALSHWAAELSLPSPEVTFFNFLASHDGIGLNPARGILSQSEIDALVDGVLAHGGGVSYKHNPDGTQSPYELNINYFDALSDPAGSEALDLQAARFLASQAIMLAITGVPGIYFHSLFGSRGWPQGVKLTGHKRTINRQKLEHQALEDELADPASLRRRVFDGYARLLRARRACPAFDPYGEQRIIDCGESVFAVLRGESVLCLQNVTHLPVEIIIDPADIWGADTATLHDLIGTYGTRPPTFVSNGRAPLQLAPYQTLWLTAQSLSVEKR